MFCEGRSSIVSSTCFSRVEFLPSRSAESHNFLSADYEYDLLKYEIGGRDDKFLAESNITNAALHEAILVAQNMYDAVRIQFFCSHSQRIKC